ncbi:LacI family transcription regulator [mine drainage metagenome]|uniref:LacI family transcription regulator n=1 Tax=mine drainage metagenome TaxID=410659 RepID=T1B688_9ZZZZ
MSKTRQPRAEAHTPIHLTMADLARLAGTSKITVSRALADSSLVNARTRERIQILAREQGYKLNISARNLRLRHSRTVGVIVEMRPSDARPMLDPYPLNLLGGITQALTTAGYSVLLTTRQDANATAIHAADGLILLGQGVHQDAVRRFDKLGLPMVVWGARASNDNHVVVGSDNRQGGQLVAEHFVRVGRRYPVFVGPPGHPEILDRLNGFVDALARKGIKPLLMRRDDFTMAAGMDAVRSLVARGAKFDSIFASSDLLAVGAISALKDLGLDVPKGVSIVGMTTLPSAPRSCRTSPRFARTGRRVACCSPRKCWT